MKENSKLRWVETLAKIFYPRHNWEDHIVLTAKIAIKLSRRLNANEEIAAVAAYLHDIGRVVIGYPAHSKSSALITRLILPLLGFSKKDVDNISFCILVHEQKGNEGFGDNLEAEIVANADSLAQLDNFLYLYSIFYSSHGRNTQTAKQWIMEKYKAALQRKITLPLAKRLARKKFQKIVRILEEPNFLKSI